MTQLSIILPVYNEKDSIEFVLKEWKNELDKQNIEHSFVICEDGSTDGTKKLLIQLQKKYFFILNQKKERRGYGLAVIDGVISAKSEYILCIDSDGQCDPRDFNAFWKNKKKAEVLIGLRTNRKDPIQRKILSKFFKSIFITLFPTAMHDPSAPFVLFKKQIIMPHIKYLTYLREGFWWGFVGMCVKKRLQIHEITINHRARLKGGTQIYKAHKIFDIFLRNLTGLLKLKIAH